MPFSGLGFVSTDSEAATWYLSTATATASWSFLALPDSNQGLSVRFCVTPVCAGRPRSLKPSGYWSATEAAPCGLVWKPASNTDTVPRRCAEPGVEPPRTLRGASCGSLLPTRELEPRGESCPPGSCDPLSVAPTEARLTRIRKEQRLQAASPGDRP